jgi:hypothetical protein
LRDLSEEEGEAVRDTPLQLSIKFPDDQEDACALKAFAERGRIQNPRSGRANRTAAIMEGWNV